MIRAIVVTRPFVDWHLPCASMSVFVHHVANRRTQINWLARTANRYCKRYTRARVVRQHDGGIATVVVISDLVTSQYLVKAVHCLAMLDWTAYQHGITFPVGKLVAYGSSNNGSDHGRSRPSAAMPDGIPDDAASDATQNDAAGGSPFFVAGY